MGSDLMMPIFKPGDPLEVLDALEDLGVTVALDRQGGKLRARPAPVPDAAREVLVANRALIHAVLLGRETGHVWMACDTCGHGRMVQEGRSPRCSLTAGCEGRHVAEKKETTESKVDTRTDSMAEAATGPTVGRTRYLDDGIKTEKLILPDFEKRSGS